MFDFSMSAARAQLRGALRSDALLSLLLAAAYFQLVWGFAIVNPRNFAWIHDTLYDLTLYLTTTSHFRFAPWSFPVTEFNSLLYPSGTSIAIADAVPLLAVPFKLLDPLLPRGVIQYMGAWLFVCVWLQALISKKIFTLLKLPVALQWIGTALMTADLPQAMAIWHFPLWAHFLVVYGFYLVLSPSLRLSRVCLLLAVSPWVTPYLFVMVLATCTAAFLRHHRSPGLWKSVAIACAVTVSSCYFVGYFHFKTGSASQGPYMADLATFFNAADVGHLGPSLRPLMETEEGFGYLGLGGLTLLGLLLVKPLVPAWRGRSVHPPALLGVCTLMALYAVSTRPMWRGETLANFEALFELGEPIFNRLRATGRFIWPIWLYIILFGVRAIHEVFDDKRVALGAGSLVLALQVADVGPWLHDPVRPSSAHHVPAPVSPRVSEQLTSKSQLMLFEPNFICKAGLSQRRDMWDLALFSAEHRLSTNTDFGALARSTRDEMKPVCQETKRLWKDREHHPEIIWVEASGKRAKRRR